MFIYEMPTKVYFGKECIAKSGACLQSLGTKAMLVTGRHSAKINGSQQAVTAQLEALGIPWILFDEVESNPSVATVRKAAVIGKAEKVDFVIAIGGGSPMDAGKCIALLCTNDLDDTALFSGSYPNRPLPIVAVPTTAGTGSEVTKAAILTNPAAGTKQAVASPSLFPAVAFADPAFTDGLSQTVTIDTAIDALSHAVEGYLATTATPISDGWAEASIRKIGCQWKYLDQALDEAVREDLLYGSLLAGIVIAQTGTTLIHAMGYQLTYYKGLTHGRANAKLFPYFMQLMEQTQTELPKVQNVWSLLQVSGLGEFMEIMERLAPASVAITDEEIEKFTALTMPTPAVAHTSYDVTEETVAKIYKTLRA